MRSLQWDILCDEAEGVPARRPRRGVRVWGRERESDQEDGTRTRAREQISTQNALTQTRRPDCSCRAERENRFRRCVSFAVFSLFWSGSHMLMSVCGVRVSFFQCPSPVSYQSQCSVRASFPSPCPLILRTGLQRGPHLFLFALCIDFCLSFWLPHPTSAFILPPTHTHTHTQCYNASIRSLGSLFSL